MRLAEAETTSPWALILADGEGGRSQPLTWRIPKRARAFRGVAKQDTPFEQTLRRSALVISRDCTMAVVSDARALFRPPVLASFPPQRVAIQPENRGSAPAILYGLLRIMRLAPKSPVVVFSAHYPVSNEASFTAQMETAIRVVVARPDLVVLLGVMPDSGDVDDRWSAPRELVDGPSRPEIYRARHFWTKPSLRLGIASFVMVAYPSAVLSMVRGASRSLFDAFAPVQMRLGTPWEAVILRQVYSRLPSTDFSKRILGTCPANLAVLCPQQDAMSI